MNQKKPRKKKKSLFAIIAAAEERLRIARFGCAEMSRPDRLRAGLYNAVVFGRMVTFAIQNLRGVVPDFDQWYSRKQEEMRADGLMVFFSNLRTEIEKKTERHTTVRGRAAFNTSDFFRLLLPAPPGAVSFFVADEDGCCGWNIEGDDGKTTKYYVDFPAELGKYKVHLVEAPPQYRKHSAQELVTMYLDKVEALVTEAKQEFFA